MPPRFAKTTARSAASAASQADSAWRQARRIRAWASRAVWNRSSPCSSGAAWVSASARRRAPSATALAIPRAPSETANSRAVGSALHVGAERSSAVFCVNTADRRAETWKAHLEPFSRLEFAVSDAAKGIARAVEQVEQGRRGHASAPTLGQGLDVFHTTKEAHTVLARQWRQPESAWVAAETASAKVERAQEQGIDARGPAGPARVAWRQATAALEQVERLESAWRRARAALELFRLDGRLNDRVHAEAEITAAVAGLPGLEWKTVRNFLVDPRSLAFLDRMHQRLAVAKPGPEWREAMAWRWWLRHRRPAATANRLPALVHAVARQRPLSEPEQPSYQRVAAVLHGTV